MCHMMEGKRGSNKYSSYETRLKVLMCSDKQDSVPSTQTLRTQQEQCSTTGTGDWEGGSLAQHITNAEATSLYPRRPHAG